MEEDCFTKSKSKGGKSKSADSLDESEKNGPENTSVGGFGLRSFRNHCDDWKWNNHGYPVNPQWEGHLELDSVSGDDNACGAMVHGMRNSISIIRESSLWILIQDSFCPPDVIRLRTAGWRWNNAELYG